MTPLEIINNRIEVYTAVQNKRDPFGPNDRNGHESSGDIIMALEIVRDAILDRKSNTPTYSGSYSVVSGGPGGYPATFSAEFTGTVMTSTGVYFDRDEMERAK